MGWGWRLIRRTEGKGVVLEVLLELGKRPVCRQERARFSSPSPLAPVGARRAPTRGEHVPARS